MFPTEQRGATIYDQAFAKRRWSRPRVPESRETVDARRILNADSGNYLGIYFADVAGMPESSLGDSELARNLDLIDQGRQARKRLEELGQYVVPDVQCGWKLSGVGPGTMLAVTPEMEGLLQQVAVGIAARATVAQDNLGLVISLAKKYAERGELGDLIQEGNAGLLRGLEHYDKDKGAISTYVKWWIRAQISRFLRGPENNLIKIPYNLQPIVKQLWKICDASLLTTGRDPSLKEAMVGLQPFLEEVNAKREADGRPKLKITERKVALLLERMFNPPESLEDKVVGPDAQVTDSWSFLEDPQSQKGYQRSEFNQVLEAAAIKSGLNPNQKRALRLKLAGLRVGGKAETDEFIGRRMGVSRQKVEQHYKKIDRRLRRYAAKEEPGLINDLGQLAGR